MSEKTKAPENLAAEFRRLYKLWTIGFGTEKDSLMMFVHLNVDRIEAALRLASPVSSENKLPAHLDARLRVLEKLEKVIIERDALRVENEQLKSARTQDEGVCHERENQRPGESG